MSVDELADALAARMGLPPQIDAALRLLQGDPHQWSTRPCATCAVVSASIGRPFGCILHKQTRASSPDGEVR